MKLTDELIDDYIRGELSSAAREDFERKLKSDAEARARVEELRLMHEMLSASAPEVPSARMWKQIRAKITQAHQASGPSLWDRLLGVLSGPRLGYGLAGMAALFFLAIGLQVAKKPQIQTDEAAQAKSEVSVPAGAPAAAPAPAPARAKAPQARPLELSAPAGASRPAPAEPETRRGPSEVERALAEQDLDGVIATMLRQRQAASVGLPSAGSGMASPVETVSFAAAPQAKRAAVRSVSAPSMADASARFDSSEASPAPALQSRLDSNGFWNLKYVFPVSEFQKIQTLLAFTSRLLNI